MVELIVSLVALALLLEVGYIIFEVSMRKYKGFDTLPSSLRNVAREAIDRYSIQPDMDRLVFPLLINGVARSLLCEVPIDDPSMSMLLVCLYPSRFTKGRFYVSLRQNRLWEAYAKAHPDGFKRPNTYGGGSFLLVSN